jgi:ROK family
MGAGRGRRVLVLAVSPLERSHRGCNSARLALGLAAVIAVVDPELIVLGGGIGGNADLLLEPVERELRALSPLRPRLAVSALGDDAVLQGAVATALATAQDRLFDPARMLNRKESIV